MLRRLLVALVVFVALDQLALYGLLSGPTLLGRPVAPFDPPLFSDGQRLSLETVRRTVAGQAASSEATTVPFDVELGWCPLPASGEGQYRYDWAGCRIGSRELPRAKTDGVRRIVAVGCSFTHGDEVGAAESWAALVDRDEGFEVANLGFGAYGLDQAYLRLQRDGLPLEPDEVWMGFLPFAAPRVTTLYRPAQRHWALFAGFKPRFLLDEGRLRLIPNPARTLADVPRLIDDQRAFLDAVEHDLWVQRAPWAYLPRGSHWSHYSAASRLVLTLFERGQRDPAGWLQEPSEVRSILRTLVGLARSAAEERGARFRFLVLPSERDVESAASGATYWSPLLDELRADGVEVVDVTKVLQTARSGKQPLWLPGGHYTVEGNRLVAEALLYAAQR